MYCVHGIGGWSKAEKADIMAQKVNSQKTLVFLTEKKAITSFNVTNILQNEWSQNADKTTDSKNLEETKTPSDIEIIDEDNTIKVNTKRGSIKIYCNSNTQASEIKKFLFAEGREKSEFKSYSTGITQNVIPTVKTQFAD